MLNKIRRSLISLGILLCFTTSPVYCGPFEPATGETGSSAVSMNSTDLVAWATGWINLTYGDRVTSTFKTPDNALGPATGNSFATVSLGEGGHITLTFDSPIKNRPGWDFAVFENGFSDTFLELGYVEVSSNGADFVRFNNISLTDTSVSEFGTIDATNIQGFAGKYKIGYGTPFDLSDLAVKDEVINGMLNLSAVTHVRIVDVPGDGSLNDTGSNPIYDPYPTNNSAGFDLEAIGVRYTNTDPSNSAPDAPQLGTPPHAAADIALSPNLTIDSTSDADSDDIHLLTRWQLATEATFQSASMVLNIYSPAHLRSLFIPELILENSTTYYWRALTIDGPGTASAWSAPYWFSTTADTTSTTITYRDWDNDGITNTDIPSFTTTNSDGDDIEIGIRPESNIQEISDHLSFVLAKFRAVSDSDSPESFPAGLFGMKVKPTHSGAPATFTVYLSKSLPETAYWYTYDTIHGWRLDPYADFSTDRTRVTVRVTDGLSIAGDNDGSSNGSIIVTGGPGIKTDYSTSTGSSNGSEAGLGEKGGCFITTVTPTHTTKHVTALLITLLLGIAFALTARLAQILRIQNKKE